MPERNGKQASEILPIRGEGIRMVRDGRLLLDVDEIEICKPGITTLLGHNGAGKSLLLKVLTGLVKPDAGKVTWGGMPPARERYARLGYMKQNAVLLRRSARANLEYVFRHGGKTAKKARDLADATLADFGLTAIADTSARLLSGGEKQRLALARMLAAQPDIVLLDEPTASLDPVSTKAIENVILRLKEDGHSIFLVTHDLRQARSLSDDIVFLNQARIFARQTANDFFNAPKGSEVTEFLGI